MVDSRKVVVNRCHGGFGLSDAALRAYAARKGLTLYPESDGRVGIVTYWTAPPEERTGVLRDDDFRAATQEVRIASNARHSELTIYDRDIARDDADLVAVVEAMGDEASGRFARLEVVEIPADVKWRIEEYDGSEWIAEEHRTW